MANVIQLESYFHWGEIYKPLVYDILCYLLVAGPARSRGGRGQGTGN